MLSRVKKYNLYYYFGVSNHSLSSLLIQTTLPNKFIVKIWGIKQMLKYGFPDETHKNPLLPLYIYIYIYIMAIILCIFIE